ncbi:MAG: helix-turn-helix domain containing protein [Nitrososphaerota archaeon]|nr:helix-turn-helix domain containing protein [Nitrososphaerota archaeon]
MWIVQKKLQGFAVTDICTSVKISRDMFYRWWNRYQAQG